MLSINEEVRVFSEHPYPEFEEKEHSAYHNPATTRSSEQDSDSDNSVILDADYIETQVDDEPVSSGRISHRKTIKANSR